MNKKTQTKKQSLVESITNVFIGYIVSVIAQAILYPLFGIEVGMKKNLLIGACFTVISLIRGYIIRRIFNKL